MTHLILASKSPRRKKLMQQLGLTFTVQNSHVKENDPTESDTDPVTFVQNLAAQKAERVAGRSSNAVIVAADTSVILKGQILGKPENALHAGHLLRQMSGQTHRVITGVCLLRTNGTSGVIDKVRFHEQTKVTFATLANEEIDAYVATGSPMDKAGAYGIQDDWGAVFVSRIEGDYYNVVGFPLHKFYQHIKEFAPELLTDTPLAIQ
ncbi:MAG: Maf family protein [Balneolaceae bacterium]